MSQGWNLQQREWTTIYITGSKNSTGTVTRQRKKTSKKVKHYKQKCNTPSARFLLTHNRKFSIHFSCGQLIPPLNTTIIDRSLYWQEIGWLLSFVQDWFKTKVQKITMTGRKKMDETTVLPCYITTMANRLSKKNKTNWNPSRKLTWN